jgi:CRISPR-associated protein Cst2
MTATTTAAATHTLDDLRQYGASGRQVSGVGIAARLELAVHALNNEGSRNNATLPRQVDVVAGMDIVQVNAISGDTIKHSFVDYLKAVIADRPGANGALPLCDPCRRDDPNRLNADGDFQQFTKRDKKLVGNEAVVRELILRCTVDDVAGLLVTQGNRNAPRRSTVQFGWQLGVPERVRTGRYTHVKLVPADPSGGAGGEEGSNLGQNIFTKPASSGVYAFVANLDLARIGRNDITLQREIDDATWRARASAALTALFHTVAVPGGAQRNTQLPHLHGVEGALAVSVSSLPPVLYSPLAEDFTEQMARVASAFGRAGSEHFILPFSDLAELGALLSGLSELVQSS